MCTRYTRQDSDSAPHMEMESDPEGHNRSLMEAFDHICAAFCQQIRLRAETAAALSSQTAATATPKHGTLERNGEPPKQQPHSFGHLMLKIGGRWDSQCKRHISTLQRSQKRRPRTLTLKGCSTHRHGAPTCQGPAQRLNCISITADGVTPHLPSWSTRM
ncbi:Hypothetical predicted protein [Pelobates cultripes]|uniref:Uncharacterized protein n=1 Tax=Pelobates cultripes TaxID=61616 RepID=A0AAD1SYF6_PELCU|nr:Hypothetical predicted protein [Pelobates cultripes]